MEQVLIWLERIRANSDLFLDIARVYVGVGLVARGIVFLQNPDFFEMWMIETPWLAGLAGPLRYYVIVAHLIGGALLAVGVATRWAAAVQIPILAGAVFLIHFPEGLVRTDQSLEFSALVLFLLCLFLVRGSGRLSLDAYRTRQKDRALAGAAGE